MQPLLELHAFRVQFRDRVVLASLDFEMAAPLVTVFGPAGGGKSTLLRALSGVLLRQDAKIGGEIRLDGKPIDESHHATLVVPHAALLVGSAGDALTSGGGPRAERLARALALLDALGAPHISQNLARPMFELQTYDVRLILLVRAALEKPKLLLLDEPTAGFSHAQLFSYCNAIRALSARVPVLVATKNALAAREFGAPVAFLSEGKICEVTPAVQFFSAPASGAARTALSSVRGQTPVPAETPRERRGNAFLQTCKSFAAPPPSGPMPPAMTEPMPPSSRVPKERSTAPYLDAVSPPKKVSDPALRRDETKKVSDPALRRDETKKKE